MEQLNEYTVRSLLVCLITVMILGGGRANADFTFGTPTKLPSPLNTPYDIDVGPCISADGLEFYFVSWREGSLLKSDGSRSEDIWLATRATTEDEWGEPVNLGTPVNSHHNDWGASISADGLTLYFNSQGERGGSGRYDLWMTTRTTKDDDWGEPVNLGPTINSSARDAAPCISADNLELFFMSERSDAYGNGDIWVTTRVTQDDPWSEPVKLGQEINNSSHGDGYPSLSADCLLLFFSSGFPGVWTPRPGGFGGCDLWMTRRASKNEPWGEPINLGPIVNSANHEFTPCISSDGSMLYFSRMTPGTSWDNLDIWQVEIMPVVDFNSDGIVDKADMCIMIDHWGEDYPLCDIGPTPFGDGVVDVQDLIVLAEHLFEDYRLVAHWPLDEIEGTIAQDIVSGNNDLVMGNPIWQPTGGKVNGAIELDGEDDCIITNASINPADGPFSVFAWIKGGMPGQTVLSQMGGSNWLSADASEGNLITELKSSDQLTGSLHSKKVITDGQWHRIGFIWNGSNRTLFVDDAKVAEDSQHNLEGSPISLCIGVGKSYAPGTFFSGLIDDVRIYNQALSSEEIAALAQ